MVLSLTSILALFSLAIYGGAIITVTILLNWFLSKYRATLSRLRANVSLKSLESYYSRPESSGSSGSQLVRGMHVAFQKLELSVGPKKILRNVTGSFPPGKLTAIMGPSGSGKTSLLNVLTGKADYGVVSGAIYLNGTRTSLAHFRRSVGYVPQDDIMIRELTVAETLYHSARTRLPSTYSETKVERVVERILSIMGLEELRDSVIGDEDTRGISGGQRKRVNIAMELVAETSILFLDEPTSGLDSTAAVEVLQVLQKLAATGLTIVAVIHQPRYEIFELIDELALLGFNGSAVYMGPRKHIGAHFASLGFSCPQRINPADFYLDVISGRFDKTHSFKLPPAKNTSLLLSSESSDVSPLASAIAIANMNSGSLPADSESDETSADFDLVNQYHTLSSNINADSADLFSHLTTTCSKLQYFWSIEKEAYNFASVSSQWVDYDDESEDDLSVDSFLGIALCYFSCLLFPPLVGLYYVPQWPWKSRPSQLFQVVGASHFFLGLATLSLVYLPLVISLVYFGISSGVALILIILAYSAIKRKNRKISPDFLRQFLVGFLVGPFTMGTAFFRRVSRKTSSSLFAGFTLQIIVVSYALLIRLRTVITPWEYAGAATVLVLVIAKFCTFLYRYQKTSKSERKTSGFFYQVWIFSKRELVIMRRSWPSILFHICLLVAGGLFTGCMYYGRSYKGPIFSYIQSAQRKSDSICPPEVLDIGILAAVCVFLEIPEDDPLIPIALMSHMSVALAAVAYAIFTFGNEKTTFIRESYSGISTGAYFVGKNLTNLILNFVAPVFFLLALLCFATLKASFLGHYGLIFGTYFCFTGLGYLVSIVLSKSISLLAGVMGVLVNMMFSGASPTLKQLGDSALLGPLLLYPSYVCYFRWVFEAEYILEIQQYSKTFLTMEILYDYHISNFALCVSMMIFIGVLFRVLAYVVLVTREP
eukprot:TRINITY_DN9377_c0_g1_i1.p1 TRINITY_DN9377_c0_g1~~TRINITY_DN9377_c0_g1_i1.p1  ORF type:complete len:948 (+),score=159.26 TRINITY_DN9377_c0_g1_i1:34-2844(+)